MKKHLLLLTFLSVTLLTVAQTWSWQNPKPQGNDLKATHFVDANTGYVVGRTGTVMKTIDGGTTWSLVNIDETTSLYGVYFLSATTGYTCGQGEIYKTTDGGSTWTNVYSSNSPSFMDIEFLNENTGFAVSESGTAIYKTIDAGTNWTQVSLTSSDGLNDIFFSNTSNGYAVGENGFYVTTIDGGATWAESTIGANNRELHKIYFIDNTAFAVGYYGSVFKSTDGGSSWTLFVNSYDNPNHDVDDYIISTVSDVYFTSSTTGYIVGEYAIWKTSDTGATWIKKNHDSSIDMSVILPIGTTTLYASGEAGLIIKSTDSGETWSYGNTDSPQTIMGVDFLNVNLGYAVGDKNTILKTTDGGTTWSSVYEPTSGFKYFNGVDILDENNIYIANQSGSIFYSNDAGATWTSASVGGYDDFSAVQMLNSTTGFACGEDGLLAKTTNGTDWTTLTSPVSTDYNLNDLYFFNSTTGFVIGGKYGEAELFKTEDAGENWTEVTLSITEEANSITFISSTHGYLVADNAKVMHTADGGATWTEQSVSIPSGIYTDDLNSVAFFDANHGVISGASGLAFYTENAGSIWTTLDIITTNWLNDVAVAGDKAIFVGNNGNILQSTTNYTLASLIADFSADVVSGDAPLTVQFTDQTTGNPTSWSWDFDNDGTEDSNEQNPSYEFTTSGTYSVKLTVSDGTNSATETKTGYITVNEPVGCIDMSTDYIVNFEDSEDLTEWQVLDANDDSNTWEIDSNSGINGTACAKYSYSYTNAADDWYFSQCLDLTADKTYEISFYYSVYSSSYPEKLKVLYGTSADATMSDLVVDLGEFNNTEFVKTTSTIDITTTASYYLGFYAYSEANQWDIYIDSLVVKEVEAVVTAPVADFTANVTSGTAPLIVNFSDASTENPTAWSWDFNNDGTEDSNEQNPSYTYTDPGTYSVKLTVTNADGSDEELKANYITVSEAVNSGIIASTTAGGYWNETTTWEGGIVPEATDSVAINGEVFATEGSECAYLIVNESGILLNAASNYGITLPVNGDIINDGIITKNTEDVDPFVIKAYKNIVNNGAWDNQNLNLYGTVDQTISGTGEFGYMAIEDYDSTTSIIAGSNLTLNNADLRLGRTNLIITNGTLITVKNSIQANATATIANGKISGGGEIKFFDDAYLGEDTEVSNISLSGKVLVHYGVHFGASISINDTLMQKSNNYPTTLYIDDHFSNIDAVIMDNPDDNDHLAIQIAKNISNNSTWSNFETVISGAENQNVSCANHLINRLYLKANVADASTFQWKKDGVAIENATSETYFIETLSPAHSGSYICTTDQGDSRTITIDAGVVEVVADFTADVTSGDAPLTVQFSDASTGNPTSWSWDFNNDGTEDSDEQNPNYVFETAGTYSVKLTVSNGSSSDELVKTEYIIVNEVVDCADPTNFTMDFEAGSDLTGWTFLDVNEDGNTWLIADEYGVDNSYCAAYGYSSTQAANDWLFSPCFDMEAGKSYTIEFKYAIAGSSYPEKLALGFGNETTADMEIIYDLGEITNEDFLTLSVTVDIIENSSYHFGWKCYSEADMYNLYLDDVSVSEGAAEMVEAAFEADVTSGDAALTVNFTDLSTGNPNAWEWDFNNDGTIDSYEQNPNYSYNEAGTYSVKLTVYNSGSSDEMVKSDYITVNELAALSLPYADYFEYANGFLPNTYTQHDIDEDGNIFKASSVLTYEGSYSCMVYTGGNAGHNWLILPKLDLPSGENIGLSFVAKSEYSSYPEQFEILVSTTTTDTTNFSSVSDLTTAPDNFTEFQFDLSAYAGQEVYIAIRHKTNNGWRFWIDALKVETTTAISSSQNTWLRMYPNPVNDIVNISFANEVESAAIYNVNGKLIEQLNITENITQYNVSKLNKGIYIIKAKSKQVEIHEKLVVN